MMHVDRVELTRQSERVVVSALLFVLCMLTCNGPRAAECGVSNALFTAAQPKEAVRIFTRPPVGPLPHGRVQDYLAKLPVDPLLETEDVKFRRRLDEAIRLRDVGQFVAVLPSDPAARLTILRDTNALGSAFAAGAGPIVRQILRWYPAAMDQWPASARSRALVELAMDWNRLDESSSQSPRPPNTPSSREEVELIAMLVTGDLDVEGIPGLQSPMGSLAMIRESDDSIAAVKILLAHGASIERRLGNYYSPLRVAAEHGNAATVRVMLEKRVPSQHALDEAFVASVSAEKLAVAILMLEHGANPNVATADFGVGDLHLVQRAAMAVRFGDSDEFLLALIRHNVDPNVVWPTWPSALMLVVRRPALMRALLERGAYPDYRDKDGNTALHLATNVPGVVARDADDHRSAKEIDPGVDPELRRVSVAMLLEFGANPAIRNASGETALMHTGPDDEGAANLLLQRASPPKRYPAPDNEKPTAVPLGRLSWLLLERDDVAASTVLAKNGSVAADDCGAYYYAATSGATRTLQSLMAVGQDGREIVDNAGMTSLIASAFQGQVETVAMMLDRAPMSIEARTMRIGDGRSDKSSVAVPASVGITPLMAAAVANRSKMVEFLLQRGARVGAVDAAGWTAIDYARDHLAADSVEVLSRYASEHPTGKTGR